MTAEIAVLNREAVALAADSAVTVSGGASRHRKTYPSATKIFSVSRQLPVGLMVYGSGFHHHTPWETIVKMHRQGLPDDGFATLREYGDALLTSIGDDARLYSSQASNRAFRTHAEWVCHMLLHLLEAELNSRVENGESVTDRLASRVLLTIVRETLKKVHSEHLLVSDEAAAMTALRATHARAAVESIQGSLETERRLGRVTRELIEELIFESVVHWNEVFDPQRPDLTGVVVAGFGGDEVFPSFQHSLVHGRIDDVYRCRVVDQASIDADQTAFVAPFAQKEMVYAFMEGVDPVYQMQIESALSTILRQYPEVVLDQVAGLPTSQRNDILRRLNRASDRTLKAVHQRLDAYREREYSGPVMEMVSVLPKEELAAMAESFVNLTSFKRHVSPELDTVGGPIDVAVISKGDGLIWIRRKHYFDANANPQFFYSRYGRALGRSGGQS